MPIEMTSGLNRYKIFWVCGFFLFFWGFFVHTRKEIYNLLQNNKKTFKQALPNVQESLLLPGMLLCFFR